jgi:hypothetical protein
MKQEIHIGEMIRSKLREEGRSVVWLAGKIHYEKANTYKLLKKPSLEASLLLRISLVMEHNFFIYYSDIYENR